MRKSIYLLLGIIVSIFVIACQSNTLGKRNSRLEKKWIKYYLQNEKELKNFLVEDLPVESFKVYEVMPQVLLDIDKDLNDPRLFRFEELAGIDLDNFEKKTILLKEEQIYGKGIPLVRSEFFKDDARGGFYSQYPSLIPSGSLVYIIPIDKEHTQVAISTDKILWKKNYTSEDLMRLIKKRTGLIK